MPTYLLDTNALSELVRHPDGAVAQRFRAKEQDPNCTLLTSVIVACEVRFGVEKRQATSLARRVDLLFNTLRVAPLEPELDSIYASIRSDLERRGAPIGQNDLLIAAHAIALDAILVTDNVREFKRVKGLRVENWLRA
jgi:tRNA(fMet)-specific endonuclease VapC